MSEGKTTPQTHLRVTDEMIRVALAAFQSGDMDWSSQDEELMRFALEEAISELPVARLLRASRPYVEDRLHRPDGEIDGSVVGLLSKIDAALATEGKASRNKCGICEGPHDNDVLTDICTDCETRINEEGSP